jgi:hypothetical protein
MTSPCSPASSSAELVLLASYVIPTTLSQLMLARTVTSSTNIALPLRLVAFAVLIRVRDAPIPKPQDLKDEEVYVKRTQPIGSAEEGKSVASLSNIILVGIAITASLHMCTWSFFDDAGVELKNMATTGLSLLFCGSGIVDRGMGIAVVVLLALAGVVYNITEVNPGLRAVVGVVGLLMACGGAISLSTMLGLESEGGRQDLLRRITAVRI